jgi:NADH:ubiquinone oxidoreductase subunit 4 (subunit M)
VVPLLALSLFLGIWPKPVLDVIEPDVREVIQQVERGSDYKEPTPAFEDAPSGHDGGGHE